MWETNDRRRITLWRKRRSRFQSHGIDWRIWTQLRVYTGKLGTCPEAHDPMTDDPALGSRIHNEVYDKDVQCCAELEYFFQTQATKNHPAECRRVPQSELGQIAGKLIMEQVPKDEPVKSDLVVDTPAQETLEKPVEEKPSEKTAEKPVEEAPSVQTTEKAAEEVAPVTATEKLDVPESAAEGKKEEAPVEAEAKPAEGEPLPEKETVSAVVDESARDEPA